MFERKMEETDKVEVGFNGSMIRWFNGNQGRNGGNVREYNRPCTYVGQSSYWWR